MAVKHRRVHYKTDECQTRVRVQLHTYRITSKMAFCEAGMYIIKPIDARLAFLGNIPNKMGSKMAVKRVFSF